MNEKEISELKRRFRPGFCNIDSVCGGFVNLEGTVTAVFRESLTLLPEDEVTKILGMLKKSLSGSLGKNLNDLRFETASVAYGAEHALLMKLRDSQLKDEDVLREFLQKIAESLKMETEYMVLLGYDAYDVPYRAKDDAVLPDESAEVFRYFICSICPIKETRPALGFAAQENKFRNLGADRILAQPELGFVFPAFDDRATNLYSALYYTRSAAENYPDFVEALFRTPVPMPAAEQRVTFQSVLEETVAEDCSYQVVQTVQDQLTGLIAEHKEQKIREPLRINEKTMDGILDYCEVPDERRKAFSERFDEEFGADAELSPANLINPRKMEVSLPEVKITVNPEHSELVTTKVIDGVKYVMIRADEGVTVNGVTISIK